ncbi:MAG: putative lipid II flippase FtsW [Candidatus Aenigmarchaeota archaeon]|nr:putative lipid II flippase FtsW [Candidatus Aenigmarchaeota archaeon]
MNKKHQPDNLLIIIVGILLAVGLICLFSSSSVVAYRRFNSSIYYLKHQLLFGIIPGLFFLFLFSKLDYHFLKKWANFLFVFSLLLLIFVLFPFLSHSVGNSKRWIELGGLTFQPSEIFKLVLLIFLASWFEKKQFIVNRWKEIFWPIVILICTVSILIALQPDIGTLGLIISLILIFCFFAGMSLYRLFILSSGGLLALLALIKIAPYRLARLTVFLNPKLDLQGIGYQLHQSLIAIGSGGWIGKGLGNASQKFFYLPEVIGDSIFSIISEELGFLLTAGLIILFVLLTYRGIKIAITAPDMFGQLLAGGIISLIILQTFINIMSMLGLIPLTGLPLPFISFGGTAMVVLLAGVGIIINISKQTK